VSIQGGEINSDGKLMTTAVGSDGKVLVVVREIPPPVKSEIIATMGSVAIGSVPAPGPAILTNPDITLNPTGTGVMTAAPSGGITTIGDAAQQLSNKTKTTVTGNSN
jgi:hypothetical protein